MSTSPSACLSSVALLAGASIALAGLPTPSQPSAWFDSLEEGGYGKLSGKLQSLLMHRDYSDAREDGTSQTIALTLNYLSPEFNGFSLGAQYVGAVDTFESGANPDPGALLSNDEFSVLNEAYLAYDFGALGWDGATLKVGRQVLNYDFAPSYNIRQKAQAFEAVVLTLEPVEGLRIDLGHLERFSSWSTRRDSSDMAWQADFVDVEQRAGVDYDSSGFQFISAVYDGCEPWSFTVYDFYGEDLYNTLGAKASYKWDLGPGRGTLTFRGHLADQNDVGRWAPVSKKMPTSINSTIYELGVDWARNGLTLSAGGVFINGSDFQTPFRTSFTIDTELLWFTDQFAGDTDSVYLKGVYKVDQWLFYAMLVMDEHPDGTNCTEFDGVIKYNFSDSCYTAFKGGVGEVDPTSGNGKDAIDLRWFFGWDF